MEDAGNEVKFKVTCTSDAIKIKWESKTPPVDNYMIRYQSISSNEENRTRDFREASTNSVVLKHLKSDTKYNVQVNTVIDAKESFYFKTSARTAVSSVLTLLQMCEKVNNEPSIYKFLPVKTTNLEKGIKIVEIISESDGEDEKTVLLLGAVCSGKSTMLDAIVNFITGVSLGDEIRFSITDSFKKYKTNSTTGITCYKIPKREEFRVHYSINLIDTPGFKDHIDADSNFKINDMLQHLFENGDIKSLSVVCIALTSPIKLTEEQRFILQSIFDIFGNDITNIVIINTFNDSCDSPVVSILPHFGISCKNSFHFSINNADLFKQMLCKDNWVQKYAQFERFFAFIDACAKMPLSKTTDVLKMGKAIREYNQAIYESTSEYQKKEKSEFKNIEEELIKECRSETVINCHTCKTVCMPYDQYPWYINYFWWFFKLFKCFTYGCVKCKCGQKLGYHEKNQFVFSYVYRCKPVKKYIEDMKKRTEKNEKNNLNNENDDLQNQILKIKGDIEVLNSKALRQHSYEELEQSTSILKRKKV